jgi:hypothetical protein
MNIKLSKPPTSAWADSIIDSATRDKIASHFDMIKEKQIAGRPTTLAEVLRGPPTPWAGATGKRRKGNREGEEKEVDRRSLLKPMFLMSVLHPFAVHLKDWEKGVPVNCGSPWTREAIDIAVARGAHPTAHGTDPRGDIIGPRGRRVSSAGWFFQGGPVERHKTQPAPKLQDLAGSSSPPA